MEQAERVDVVVSGRRRTYERHGWLILAVSALLGIFGAVVTTIPPAYILSSPFFEDAYPIMGVLGITSLGFNIFALVLTLIPYRRGERWAWYTLWLLPLLWLSLFALAPDLPLYLALAIVTAAGLVLPYRRFFHPDGARAPRVR
jgi:hypothetical protein